MWYIADMFPLTRHQAPQRQWTSLEEIDGEPWLYQKLHKLLATNSKRQKDILFGVLFAVWVSACVGAFLVGAALGRPATGGIVSIALAMMLLPALPILLEISDDTLDLSEKKINKREYRRWIKANKGIAWRPCEGDYLPKGRDDTYPRYLVEIQVHNDSMFHCQIAEYTYTQPSILLGEQYIGTGTWKKTMHPCWDQLVATDDIVGLAEARAQGQEIRDQLNEQSYETFCREQAAQHQTHDQQLQTEHDRERQEQAAHDRRLAAMLSD